jgi:hypothetical protein
VATPHDHHLLKVYQFIYSHQYHHNRVITSRNLLFSKRCLKLYRIYVTYCVLLRDLFLFDLDLRLTHPLVIRYHRYIVLNPDYRIGQDHQY